MTTYKSPPDKRIPPWAWFIFILMIVPWTYASIVGLVVSPLIHGFRAGRKMAGELAAESRLFNNDEEQT